MLGDIIKRLREETETTQAELARIIGCTNQAVSQYEKGTRTPDNIALVKIARHFNVSTDYLLGNSDMRTGKSNVHNRNDVIRVPVLGSVAAGIPLEAVEDVTDWEEIPASMGAGGEAFIALTIHGTSMEPKMSEGDVVIVRLQDDVDSGDIALVYVNGDDATCKKVVKTERGIWLKGLNDTFEPLWFSWDEVVSTPVKIAGRVVELRAKF